jgi:hypothetical protein
MSPADRTSLKETGTTDDGLVPPRLLTVADVVHIFRCDERTVRRWRREGMLRGFHIPTSPGRSRGLLRFHPSEIRDFIDRYAGFLAVDVPVSTS